jgi:NADPH:quinone reductase-like Zn-dependent oxidoreductase
MKAIFVTNYGSPDVLQLQETEKPAPKGDEILVKVSAASITAADSMMRKGTPRYARLFLGLVRPSRPIPGSGFAGVVEAVGETAKHYKIGDAVFGETGVGFSANAEYVCMSEDGVLAIKPEELTFAQAAAICDGALTSWNFLNRIASIQPGQKVLVNGASGSLGSAAIQIAKTLGAEVTGVCGPSNQAMVKSLGADKVIDYTQQDFTRDHQQYDIIYDAVGKASFKHCKPALRKNSVYLSPVLSVSLLLQMIWTSKFSTKKARFSATGILPVPVLRTLLSEVLEEIKAGNIRPVIDRRYPLEQTAEAHRYVDTGHKKGNIVLAFDM